MSNQNISYCLIATIFVVASVYTMLTCKHCSPFLEYEQSLSPQQKLIYEEIVSERQRIYLTGLILGTVLAFLYLYMNNLSLNPLENSCVFVAIAMLTQYFYYKFTPKSRMMLSYMQNQDQINKWLDVYNHMTFRYHFGMLLGLIGYFIFSYNIQN